MSLEIRPGYVNLNNKIISSNRYLFRDPDGEYDPILLTDVQNSATIALTGNVPGYEYGITFEANGFKRGIRPLPTFTSSLERFTADPMDGLGQTVHMGSDRIQVTDEDRVVLDTNRGMPHIYDTVITQLTLPSRPALPGSTDVSYQDFIIADGKRADTDFILTMWRRNFSRLQLIMSNGSNHLESMAVRYFDTGVTEWLAHSIVEIFINSSGQLIVRNKWINRMPVGNDFPQSTMEIVVYLGKFPNTPL